MKTIYGQKVELYRQFYISNYYKEPKSTKRGRPKLIPQDTAAGERHRDKYVIEETSGVYDVYEVKKPLPLPPGNVLYTEGFVDVWHKLVGKEEEEELCIVLLRYIGKILARVNNHDDAKVRKWAPERNIQHCCSQCGLNHEAHDFIRAVLLRLIDQLEKNDVVLNYLKDNDLLTQKDFELVAGRKT